MFCITKSWLLFAYKIPPFCNQTPSEIGGGIPKVEVNQKWCIWVKLDNHDVFHPGIDYCTFFKFHLFEIYNFSRSFKWARIENHQSSLIILPKNLFRSNQSIHVRWKVENQQVTKPQPPWLQTTKFSEWWNRLMSFQSKRTLRVCALQNLILLYIMWHIYGKVCQFWTVLCKGNEQTIYSNLIIAWNSKVYMKKRRVSVAKSNNWQVYIGSFSDRLMINTRIGDHQQSGLPESSLKKRNITPLITSINTQKTKTKQKKGPYMTHHESISKFQRPNTLKYYSILEWKARGWLLKFLVVLNLNAKHSSNQQTLYYHPTVTQ